MITAGLLVRLDAKPGIGGDADELLRLVHRLACDEPQTVASFLLRFAAGRYGLLDLFECELARREHEAGAASQGISYRACLFAAPPTTVPFEVTSWCLPEGGELSGLDHGTFVDDVAGSAADAFALRTPGAWVDGVTGSGHMRFRFAPQPVTLTATGEAFTLLGPELPEETVALPHVAIDVAGQNGRRARAATPVAT
jgi:hypothetical protein